MANRISRVDPRRNQGSTTPSRTPARGGNKGQRKTYGGVSPNQRKEGKGTGALTGSRRPKVS